MYAAERENNGYFKLINRKPISLGLDGSSMAEHPSITEITKSDVDSDPGPEIIDLGDRPPDDLLGAFNSSTARALLQQLRASPTYPSELAEEIDTSVQNVHYHLTKLEEADAVEAVDTVYSEKGREMTVYAPTADPLVLVSGSEERRQQVVEALSHLLGAIGMIAAGSIAVQELTELLFYPDGPTPIAMDGGQYAITPVTNVAPPIGLYFFVAGILGLVGYLAWRRY